MTIYVDDGKTVKTYHQVKVSVAKAVMTLLETDDELVWTETPANCISLEDIKKEIRDLESGITEHGWKLIRKYDALEIIDKHINGK